MPAPLHKQGSVYISVPRAFLESTVVSDVYTQEEEGGGGLTCTHIDACTLWIQISQDRQ